MRSLVLLVLGVGCATAVPQLSPTAEAVLVTKNPTLVSNCKLIGPVDGSILSLLSGPKWAAAEEAGTKLIKFRTDSLGGNAAWISHAESDGNGAIVKGEAYRCG